MEFRLELQVKPFKKQINIQHRVMLMGSCFTDHISRRLALHKFNVLENPHGIIFNPVSIHNAISQYIEHKKFETGDLFYFNELWTSWWHHSLFSNANQQDCLNTINQSIITAHEFLKTADWLVLTLGSAFVYELKESAPNGKPGQVAANCHKVPPQHFHHRLLQYTEVEQSLQKTVAAVKAFNPAIQIMITVSPVRHAREGLVENNRSKALLHTAIHHLESNYDFCHYFPSYELVIDDLRDYRFYAEDLVHPNYQATQYVWEKFVAACIDEESQLLMKQIFAIQQAKNHKPLHSESIQHKHFMENMLQKTRELGRRFPFLNLQEEEEYFNRI